MKKLFQFIKNLFIKVDQLEAQAEKLIEETTLLSPEAKAEAKKVLETGKAIEAKAKKVVGDAEVAEQKIEKAIKSKNIADIADAAASTKEVAGDAAVVVEEVKVVAKKAKKRYYKPKAKKNTPIK